MACFAFRKQNPYLISTTAVVDDTSHDTSSTCIHDTIHAHDAHATSGHLRCLGIHDTIHARSDREEAPVRA